MVPTREIKHMCGCISSPRGPAGFDGATKLSRIDDEDMLPSATRFNDRMEIRRDQRIVEGLVLYIFHLAAAIIVGAFVGGDGCGRRNRLWIHGWCIEQQWAVGTFTVRGGRSASVAGTVGAWLHLSLMRRGRVGTVGEWSRRTSETKSMVLA
jgi:hypothetical protein